ncbi:Uncharacterised protein (plasmid) [Mesomycoplasma conjunctivae]|nr:Uncharacterised protein [Mesomycoplasma conjunctivae]
MIDLFQLITAIQMDGTPPVQLVQGNSQAIPLIEKIRFNIKQIKKICFLKRRFKWFWN